MNLTLIARTTIQLKIKSLTNTHLYTDGPLDVLALNDYVKHQEHDQQNHHGEDKITDRPEQQGHQYPKCNLFASDQMQIVNYLQECLFVEKHQQRYD